MAMNPMQRRARNSFLIGFLIALVIMAAVVAVLLNKVKGLKEEINKINSFVSKQYVATEDLESGQIVTMDSFSYADVRTSIDSGEFIDGSEFEAVDKNGNPMNDAEGNPVKKDVMLKINVPAGTIITKDMLTDADNKTTDSDRIQEYNMIALPSQLKNGDYIDVRISLTNGQDYVVLTKKRVIGVTATGIWMKMNEYEMNLLNSAIVESYVIDGAKLYAIEYVEPGLQKQATVTYPVGQDVLTLMQNNPNIVDDVKKQYENYANYYTPKVAESRVSAFESPLDANRDNRTSLVQSGNASEIQKIQTAREEYISSLEGTEDVGYQEN